MGILDKFSRKIQNNRKSVVSIPKQDRILIEDWLENEWTVAEVVGELPEYTPEQISRIKDTKRRTEKRRTGVYEENNLIDNPVVKAKRELEAGRILFEVDKLNFDRKKLQEEQREYFSTEAEEPPQLELPQGMFGLNPLLEQGLMAMAGAFISKLPPKQGEVALPQQTTPPIPPQAEIIDLDTQTKLEEHKPVEPKRNLSDDKIKSLINGLPKKLLKKCRSGEYDKEFIKSYASGTLPNATEEDLERGFELVMTE